MIALDSLKVCLQFRKCVGRRGANCPFLCKIWNSVFVPKVVIEVQTYGMNKQGATGAETAIFTIVLG